MTTRALRIEQIDVFHRKIVNIVKKRIDKNNLEKEVPETAQKELSGSTTLSGTPVFGPRGGSTLMGG